MGAGSRGRSPSETQLSAGHLSPVAANRASRPGHKATFDWLPDSRPWIRHGATGGHGRQVIQSMARLRLTAESPMRAPDKRLHGRLRDAALDQSM